MKHAKVKINGKVQGVFFRAETKKKAEELSLLGFVRNEDDGSVYVEVEGDETLIADLIKWFNDGGPELATVEDVNVECEDSLKQFQEFSIRS
jgi:acylphosphatase